MVFHRERARKHHHVDEENSPIDSAIERRRFDWICV